MSAPDQEDPAEDAPPPTPPPQRWTRRLAPLFLAAGLGLAAATLFSSFPKERQVELQLDDAATVVGLQLAWTGGAGDDAPLQGSTWRFSAGRAPRAVRTTVRLPDGAYDVAITVDRTGGQEASRRTVTLGDADRITFPVR